MAEIMGAQSQSISKDLVHEGAKPGSRGKLIVRAESLAESNIWAQFRIQCQNMPNIAPGCLCFSGDLLPIRYEWHRSSSVNANVYSKVFESEVVGPMSRHPRFLEQKRSTVALANADPNTSIRIIFFAIQERLGYCQTTINELERGTPLQFVAAHGQTNAQVSMELFKTYAKPGFVDYLRGGWQISLTTAIDYTASNKKDNLHGMHTVNQYQQAIGSVGNILEFYDYDKMFPTFGFGGVPSYMPAPPGKKEANHCWALNGLPQQPACAGIQGMLQCYANTLP
jgi:hypothetical protein